MEPVQKKAKITGHFRVALKPTNITVEPALKKLKQQDHGKENIEVITISDDEDDDLKQKNHNNQHRKHNQTLLQPPPPTLHKQQIQQTHQKTNHNQHHIHNSNQHNNNNNAGQVRTLINWLNSNAIKATNAVNCFDKALKQIDTNKPSSQQTTVTLEPTSQKPPILPPTPKTRTSSGPKQLNVYNTPPGLGCSVHDHDKKLLGNVFCEPFYAWDIFQYYREQELKVQSKNYFMSNDVDEEDESTQIYYVDGKISLKENNSQNRKSQERQITPELRSELVDWLVFLQNHFALDHEVLYMAVKIADQYLMRKISLPQSHLPLLYITSFLISVKYDERVQPCSITELIHESKIKYNIRYSRRQVIRFEADILNTLNFELRYPLSYGFLRRFATCTKSSREILNLSRYILESSLLDHDVIDQLESRLAAASLLLAFEMLSMRDAWNESAVFYTGYKRDDIKDLSTRLNNHISRLRGEHVRRKYKDEVFMSVARIPPLTQELK